MTLDVPAGSLVAFVGPSGAGKITASYLVRRLYDVDVDVNAGSVPLDDHDVRDLTLSTLGRATRVVTQESYQFHASVRDTCAAGPTPPTTNWLLQRRPRTSTSASAGWTPAGTRPWGSAATGCPAGRSSGSP